MVPEEWLAAVVHLKKTFEPLGQAMQQLLINDLRDRPPMGRPAGADVSTTFAN
jgi:hypothetical protein